MQYFVTSNLHHNGKAYTRGQEISLSDKEAAVNSLLAAGVIQTDPIGEAPSPAPEPETVQPQPEMAGKPLETGEPSIDGKPDRSTDNAQDVSPVIDEPKGRMKSLSPDVKAKAPAKNSSRKAAPKAEKANSQAAEPDFDPSANL